MRAFEKKGSQIQSPPRAQEPLISETPWNVLGKKAEQTLMPSQTLSAEVTSDLESLPPVSVAFKVPRMRNGQQQAALLVSFCLGFRV